ncbi:unnamed protein product [Schistosoma margrebowiei]|uniref:Uncharacterized protein n=1 Tax=Schistosoma margrebowiei TaxID=48269 RepID=A0A183LGD6_9TREM|nr:unnamed protein product [Schistosoma margrebowiei]
MNNLCYCTHTHKREHNCDENDELYSANKFKENSRTGKTRKREHYWYNEDDEKTLSTTLENTGFIVIY